jgi:DnaJ-class molecular chaperone
MMNYQRASNSRCRQDASVSLAKQQNSSEALQDLIDILKQNYVSDCLKCDGSGLTLKKRVCEPCRGSGKRQLNTAY